MNSNGDQESRLSRSENGNKTYEFGDFRLDAAQRLLFRDGESVHIPPKSFELLAFFVANPNQVIDKETLMREVWPDAFVEEANISVHISSLRKVLGAQNGGANGLSPIEIKTFPKIGYRFTADVELLEPSNGLSVADDTPASARGTAWKKWLYAGVPVAAVVMIILGYALYQGFARSDKAVQTMTSPPGFEHSGPYAISPNGEYVANSLVKDGKYSLYMTHLPSNSRIQLVPPGPDVYLGMTFARDGNSLFFIRSSDSTTTLHRVPILGGTLTKIMDDVGWHFSLSPKDDSFAFVRKLDNGESALMIANIDGTDARTIATRQPPDIYGDSIAWAPDGRIIAAIVGGRIVGVDTNTQQETPLSEVFTTGIGDGLVWLPDSSGLLAVGGDMSGGNGGIWHVAFPSGRVERVTNDLNKYGRVDVSADGRTIISARYEDTSRLWISDAVSDSPMPITTPYEHGFNWIRWAPSNRIVFASNLSGQRDVWIMNSDGTDERQITRDAGNEVMPIVSPNEEFIIFASNRGPEGKVNLWRVKGDGTDPVRLTTGHGENQPAITPDGLWVYYTSGEIDSPPLERTLWQVSIDGADARQVVEGPAYGADISPDGKFLACWFKTGDSPWKIGVFSVNGGKPLKAFDAPRGQPVKWTSDGNGISYARTEKGISNVWVQPLTGGPARQVTKFTSARILQFDWSKDNQIACTRTERQSELVLIKNFR